jgi:uncharacterized membrane protein YphA (DoxX/SURF4 family)
MYVIYFLIREYNTKMTLVLISTIYITLLFFLSGFHKIKDFTQVVKGFMNKTSIPLMFSKIIIGGVILLEIVAPFIISLYSYNSNPMLHTYTKMSLLGLIVFTILATLIYHFPPFGSNYYAFMSNLSTLGGLLLLYKHFSF